MNGERHNDEATAGATVPAIAIVIHGHKAYACAAENLALTIREHSPTVPVHVWAPIDMALDASLFTDVHPLDGAWYAQGPGACKTLLYDLLPEGEWLYLDADTLCIADIRPAIDRLRAHDFAVEVLGKGGETDSIAYMPWATQSTIKRVTDAPDGATYFGVQSSWVWLRKPSITAADIYTAAKATRFTVEDLKEPWGRDIPDELRMSAALTKTGIDPHSERLSFYGSDHTFKNFTDVAAALPLACLYGDQRRHRLIKTLWIDTYERVLKNLHHKHGRVLKMGVRRIMDNKYINR